MKIAYIDECYQTSRHGGISTWTQRLSQQLKSSGVETEIYSYHHGLESKLPDVIKLFPNLRELVVYPLINKKYLPEIEKRHDIVHFTAATSMVMYALSVPSVISVHYLQSRQSRMLREHLPFRYKILFNPLLLAWFGYYEKIAFRRADLITVCRESFKDHIVEKYGVDPEKIVTVKYGLDIIKYNPNWDLSKKEKMVLYIGRGTVAKGFDTLVQAADKIEGKIVAIATRIPSFCQRIIEKRENFIVKSNISENEVIDLLQKASVFVMPSLSEGSPLVTLEAMACGLPVVCTTEGSGDYIRDGQNGYIIPFRDKEALANRVNFLLSHPNKALEFGRRNRKLVEEEYTLAIIAGKILAIYRKLMNED